MAIHHETVKVHANYTINYSCEVCRSSPPITTLYTFNYACSSTGEIHMGGNETYVCNPFFCYNFRGEKCCKRDWSPFISYRHRQGNPYRFIVYGDEPIEITHDTEWVTNDAVHYPTDLGVFVTRDKNDSRALVLHKDYLLESVFDTIIQFLAEH